MSDESPEVLQDRISVSPELGNKLAEAKANVGEQMKQPEAAVATGTEQMGLLASFGNLYKEMIVKKLGIGFKDVKAVLGIVPFVPLLSKSISGVEKGVQLISTVDKAVMAEAGVAKAQKAVTKAERWAKWFKGSEKAKQKFATATSKLTNAQREASAASKAAKMGLEAGWGTSAAAAARTEGVVSRFVRKNLVHDIKATDYVINYEKAVQSTKNLSDTEKILTAARGELPATNFAERVGKRAVTAGKLGILHSLGPIIDPTPDVPGVVVLGSIGAGFVFPPAEVVAPAWQYLHNRYESVKVSWETAMKAKDIIKTHFDRKIGKLKEPKVEHAAKVFVPASVTSSV